MSWMVACSVGTNMRAYIDGPARDRSVPITNALETPQSRTKPSVHRYAHAHAHAHACTQSQGHAHWHVCRNLRHVNFTVITERTNTRAHVHKCTSERDARRGHHRMVRDWETINGSLALTGVMRTHSIFVEESGSFKVVDL